MYIVFFNYFSNIYIEHILIIQNLLVQFHYITSHTLSLGLYTLAAKLECKYLLQKCYTRFS